MLIGVTKVKLAVAPPGISGPVYVPVKLAVVPPVISQVTGMLVIGSKL